MSFFAAFVVQDASAARGGLLEPISQADTSYPDSMRRALLALSLGECSPPILLDKQYAVLVLTREIPADGVTFDETRDEMMDLARLETERLAMDRTARSLLAHVQVTIFDEELRASWTSGRRGGGLTGAP